MELKFCWNLHLDFFVKSLRFFWLLIFADEVVETNYVIRIIIDQMSVPSYKIDRGY